MFNNITKSEIKILLSTLKSIIYGFDVLSICFNSSSLRSISTAFVFDSMWSILKALGIAITFVRFSNQAIANWGPGSWSNGDK